MLIAKPWGLTDFEKLDDNHYRFTALIFKSSGTTKIKGCLFVIGKRNILMMPQVLHHKGSPVLNSDQDHLILRNLVERAVAKYELKKRNESSEASPHKVPEAAEPLEL